MHVSVAMMHKKLLRASPEHVNPPVLLSYVSKKRKIEKESTASLNDLAASR